MSCISLSSSISFAIETPSLIITTEPFAFLIAAFLPLGPIVALTASATALTPSSNCKRALLL